MIKIRKMIKNDSVIYFFRKLYYYWLVIISYLISTAVYAKMKYRRVIGKNLNLKNPKTYDEKLWSLIINNKSDLLTICTDKYLVRNYVENCGLEHLLIKCIKVYEHTDEIDFSDFKEPVFLKCTHWSGGNIVYDPS